MHKSRMAAMVFDCQSGANDEAAAFWSRAIGRPVDADASAKDPRYMALKCSGDDMDVLLQSVDHPSRIHLDIETDDIEAEARRLEALGAKRVGEVKSWLVMEAPTGHRFCLVRPQRPGFDDKANVWD